MQQSPIPPPEQSPILIAKIIWIAMFVTTFVYYFVVARAPHEQMGNELLQPLGIAAAVIFVIALKFPESMYRKVIEQKGRMVEKKEALNLYLVPFIIRMSLSETICIFGLINALRSGVKYYYPFWIASLIAMAMAFPSESAILAKVEKYKSGRF
jgi:hypothetical protein